MFDVLVFTDATAAESLSGSPGFQFIAHSPGATRTDESVTQQRLQHAVPASLPPEDWSQHPPTCIYTRVDNRMYLSRGQSTGATLGGRPGNQLTVTVMTSDPYDVLPMRPAQLYASPSWELVRPSSQDLAPWDAPVDISEDFDIPGLHSLVVNDPWAIEMLPHALTMLEQTQAERRTRLFIRHPDQEVVMRWVALLSRFLDADSALGFEFRVFTDDPLRSNTHVVGVHPRLSPELTAHSAEASGVSFIDLEQRELSPITPSESAILYARWFISGDPYEALEAIEVGRRWSRHMDGGTAAKAAEIATMGSTRGEVDARALRASVDAIVALATAHELDELEAYGDELADVAASCPPTCRADLLAIDTAVWAAASAGDDELAQSLALAALEWTAAQPSLLNDWAEAARPPSPLTWRNNDARDHAAGLLAESLIASVPSTLPSTFTLAKFLNTGISAEAISTPIDLLVDEWIAAPELTKPARTWIQVEVVTLELSRKLDAKLTAGDRAVTQSLLAGAWDWLAPTPWTAAPDNPVSRWLAVRELRGADAARRKQVIDAVQSTLPNSSWNIMLPTDAGLIPDEVVGWIKAHGALDPALAIEVERVLHDPSRFPAWQRTGGAKVLHAVSKLGAAIPTPLVASVDAQAEIIEFFNRALESKDQPTNAPLRTLGKRFSGHLNGLYSEWIKRAVLESVDIRAAVALAEGPGQATVIALVESQLVTELRNGLARAMLAAVRLLDPELGHWSDAAKNALDVTWDDKTTEPTREVLLASIDRRLRPAELELLDKYLEGQSRGRITRGVLRGAKSIFGNKDK